MQTFPDNLFICSLFPPNLLCLLCHNLGVHICMFFFSWFYITKYFLIFKFQCWYLAVFITILLDNCNFSHFVFLLQECFSYILPFPLSHKFFNQLVNFFFKKSRWSLLFKETIMPIPHKLFQNIEEEEIFYNPFLETNIMYLYLIMISSREHKEKSTNQYLSLKI